MVQQKWLATILLHAILVLPLLAQADQQGQGEQADNCYEHKGKVKCRGDKGKDDSDHGSRSAGGGPPPWAPAHGWRRNNGGPAGYARASRDDEYIRDERSGARVVLSNGHATVDVGIEQGTCNRQAISTVVGGVIGGVIGNRVGEKENREVATILGVVVGGMVGNRIGRSMDKSDQHCTGQALEQAQDRQTVRWRDQEQSGEYRVTPQRTYEADGRYCRDYITEYQRQDNTIQRDQASACRSEEGVWKRVKM